MSESKLATMRDWWLTIHRWLGVAIGVFFAIAAFTGGVLVYEHELDGLINGGRFPVTAGDVGVERVLDGVAAAHPDAVVRRIVWPMERQPVYQADLEIAGSNRTVWVDPGTGNVIEATRPQIPLLQAIRRTHTSLLAGRFGVRLVVYSSMLALFSLCTGLILWWPGVRRFFRAFAVRTDRGFYTFNFDLHQAMGAATLPLLFLITMTGVLIYYEPAFKRVVRPFVAEEPDAVEEWASVELEERSGAVESLPLPVLFAAARAVVPAARPFGFRVPSSDTEPVTVDFQHGRSGTAGIYTTVLIDPRDGAVLQVRDPKRLEAAVRISRTLTMNLHVGGFGGMPVRILYLVVCFTGGCLATSGIVIWWLKRKKRTGAAERRAEQANVSA